MDDKELVARLSRRGNRYDDGAMMHGELINPDGPAAIACIEELEAMYNSLGHSSLKVIADLGAKLGTAEARIERLKGYTVHDDTCEDRGAYPGSCTCGLSRLLKEIGDG